MAGAQLPFISVVVPVRNEARHIGRTLRQLLAQEYPADRFEVIVADGMSTDGTAALVAEVASGHPQVRLVSNDRRLSGAGRNAGFREGKGEVFVVVDGHCFVPDDRLLANTARLLVTTGADCLGRPQPLDPPGLTPFQRAVALARGSWLGHGRDTHIYDDFEGFASPVSNGATYRRAVIEGIGPIDEAFDACEDVEFNYRVERAGFTCFTSPQLTVRYYPRETLPALLRQMARYGAGRFRFVRKHPEALSAGQLVPAAFLLGLLLLPASLAAWTLGAGSVKMLAGGHLALYAAYVALVFLESSRLAFRGGWRLWPLLPAIFVGVHAGLGWGFLGAALRRWLKRAES